MCAEKFPLVSMGGRAEGLACADPGARTPIGASGIYFIFLPEFLFIIVRSPFKNLNSFDNPFWDFNNGGNNGGNFSAHMSGGGEIV